MYISPCISIEYVSIMAEDQFESDIDDDQREVDLVPYHSDTAETDAITDHDSGGEEEKMEMPSADVGSGWGRIVYSPLRRGRRVEMDVCRATNQDATEGSFDRIVLTHSKNPTLHHQARRSLWGDLWPF